ncbi:3-isopropylmalate dehydratase small subunit [Paenibacillus elgii]
MGEERSRVWLFGNNVNTDLMSPSYTWNMEWEEAKRHILINHEGFASGVKPGDIIVAGSNFGCGSSREAAPANLLKLGVKAVVAKSFARIFFRNSIALGLPVMVSNEAADMLRGGDHVKLQVAGGTVTREAPYLQLQTEPYSEELLELINGGGLIARLKLMKDKGLV